MLVLLTKFELLKKWIQNFQIYLMEDFIIFWKVLYKFMKTFLNIDNRNLGDLITNLESFLELIS